MFLTVQQAATITGTTVAVIHHAIRKGSLPPYGAINQSTGHLSQPIEPETDHPEHGSGRSRGSAIILKLSDVIELAHERGYAPDRIPEGVCKQTYIRAEALNLTVSFPHDTPIGRAFYQREWAERYLGTYIHDLIQEDRSQEALHHHNIYLGEGNTCLWLAVNYFSEQTHRTLTTNNMMIVSERSWRGNSEGSEDQVFTDVVFDGGTLSRRYDRFLGAYSDTKGFLDLCDIAIWPVDTLVVSDNNRVTAVCKNDQARRTLQYLIHSGKRNIIIVPWTSLGNEAALKNAGPCLISPTMWSRVFDDTNFYRGTFILEAPPAGASVNEKTNWEIQRQRLENICSHANTASGAVKGSGMTVEIVPVPQSRFFQPMLTIATASGNPTPKL